MGANANGNTNVTFRNLRDYKLEFGYTPKNNDRHHFRLAYDYLENIYEGKVNTYNDIYRPLIAALMGNPFVGFAEDVKGNLITFSYTYKLSTDTRLKLCYQKSKVEAKDVPDQDGSLYFVEIYSRF